MSSGSFKNVIYKMGLRITYFIYMYTKGISIEWPTMWDASGS